MKKFFTIFFVTLGVIFSIVLLVLGYLWFADPFEIKPLLGISDMEDASVIEESSSSATETESSAQEEVTTKNPNLTPAQENALELIGVDPTAIPDSISPEQLSCFVRVLGQARVTEIQSGAAPSAIEIFKAKECL